MSFKCSSLNKFWWSFYYSNKKLGLLSNLITTYCINHKICVYNQITLISSWLLVSKSEEGNGGNTQLKASQQNVTNQWLTSQCPSPSFIYSLLVTTDDALKNYIIVVLIESLNKKNHWRFSIYSFVYWRPIKNNSKWQFICNHPAEFHSEEFKFLSWLPWFFHPLWKLTQISAGW